MQRIHLTIPLRQWLFTVLASLVIVSAALPASAQDQPPTSTPDPAQATPVPDALVRSAKLNLRKGPDNRFDVVGQVKRQDALTVVAQIRKCTWLKVVNAEQVAGWLPYNRSAIRLHKPCDAIPDGITRPESSIVMPNKQPGGPGKLTVENFTASDGVVILTTLEEQPTVAAYVRANETFSLDGIQNGVYYLYFSTGADWLADLGEFLRNARRMRFEDTFEYGRYGSWRVTLHTVPGGNAGAAPVAPGQFPPIQP